MLRARLILALLAPQVVVAAETVEFDLDGFTDELQRVTGD